MDKLTKKQFEKIVDEGIGAIPEKFLQKLDNVIIVIEDDVTAGRRKRMKIGRGYTLFGLYEGVPQTERGAHYTNVLPDKITIFQRPIKEEAEDIDEAKEIVKNTVWHEIAHHFGMDEKEVRMAEVKRAKKQ